jgi:hypothetical protein
MTGEQLQLKYRKKVREEFENVSDKIKNAIMTNIGNHT